MPYDSLVSKPSEGSEESATSDVPPDHDKARSAAALEPPVRPSALELRPDKPTFPDDSNLARTLRKVDVYIGLGEQAVLVFLLAALVALTAGSALLEKTINFRFHEKDDVIRACTFALAMIGAAFASHQAKHLALDLISRKLPGRARMFLRVFLGVFTLFILVLFIRSGLQNADIESGMADEGKLLSNARLAWLIPIGAFLMLVHTVLHTVIDVDYAARNKLPPERERSAH